MTDYLVLSFMWLSPLCPGESLHLTQSQNSPLSLPDVSPSKLASAHWPIFLLIGVCFYTMHKRLSLRGPNNRAQKLMKKRLNCSTDSFTNVFLVHLIGFLFVFHFWNRISLCSPGCPRTSYVEQSRLQLIEIHLPLLPECWSQRTISPCLASFISFNWMRD